MIVIEIIFWLCVALLPSSIHGKVVFADRYEKIETVKKDLKKILETGDIVNGIFKPSDGGFLGHGGFGVVYKGALLAPIEREVAMKFTHVVDQMNTEKEYATYAYLNAIDNPRIELYGIPAVYYYGSWSDYTMMAVSLLDSAFNSKLAANDLDDVDLLILCKEFVRISKYIHSRGIHHNDIKCDHMMFRRSNGFIIDYNLANKMYNATTLDASSLKTGIQYIKNDWKWFMQSVCKQVGIDINLNCHSYDPETKEQTQNYMRKFEKIGRNGLRRVIVEMGNSIYGIKGPSKKNDKISFYDEIYEIINEEIAKFEGKTPKLVHWLSEQEENEAMIEMETNPIPSIASIPDPLKLVVIIYPDVKFDYFQKKIVQLTIERLCLAEKMKNLPTIGHGKL